MAQTINVNRKERLERLFDLAQAYRGWTRKELAQELGRDPTKLAPESGNPKFDLILQISEVIDWTLDEVADWLWFGKEDNPEKKSESSSFDHLDQKAQDAHRSGEYKKLIRIAHSALDVASNAEEKARAYNRAAGGWDGLGRFSRVLKAAQAGLRENPIQTDLRLLLLTTAANAHYTLWQLDESLGMAQTVIDHYKENIPETNRAKVAQSHAWYVLGHTQRRLLDIETQQSSQYAYAARCSLHEAMHHYEHLAQEIHESFGGIANTCRAGILETDVFLGQVDAREALARVVDVISSVVDTANVDNGDWLESYGWWSIIGCNITLRHIADERDIQRYMALFTNKADEIADQLNHWAMRERVFSMQFEGRQRLIGWTGQDIPIVIDNDDVRLITGTMGRFPQFRKTGWSILNFGNIIKES
jgi:tetratricopeptide (TPR) repeat protein